MRVKEGSGVKAGTYVGSFEKLILNKKNNGPIHPTKNGPKVMFEIKDASSGVFAPASFYWDPEHYSFRNTLGILGTPARVVEKWLSKGPAPAIVRKLEQEWKQRAETINAWVPDDNGWVAVMKPDSGSFQCQFLHFSTRDKETDRPIHEVKVYHGVNKSGQSYVSENDKFTCLMQVTSGSREGATFYYPMHYRVVTEGGEPVIDKSGSRGEEFYSFFKMHGVDFANINIKAFADPGNLLPELEPVLQKAGTQLIAELENGWPKKVTRAADASTVEIDLGLEEGSGIRGSRKRKGAKKRRPAEELFEAETKKVDTADFRGTLMNIINKEVKSTWFDVESLSQIVPTPKLKKFISAKKLPKKPITKYTNKEVVLALKKLGYNQIANAIKEQM